jgi:hypothetical protein
VDTQVSRTSLSRTGSCDIDFIFVFVCDIFAFFVYILQGHLISSQHFVFGLFLFLCVSLGVSPFFCRKQKHENTKNEPGATPIRSFSFTLVFAKLI